MIFGIALREPSTQMYLPVLNGDASIVLGYYPIPQTTFMGVETSFMIGDLVVSIEPVTIPKENSTTHVKQYMAAVFRSVHKKATPWMSKDFVSSMVTNSYHHMHHTSLEFNKTDDQFLTALQRDLNFHGVGVVPLPPPPPGADVLKNWKIQIGSALSADCNHIDINWLVPFLRSEPNAKQPIEAVVISAPPEVTAKLVATRMVDGVPIYETLRIANKVPIILPAVIELQVKWSKVTQIIITLE